MCVCFGQDTIHGVCVYFCSLFDPTELWGNRLCQKLALQQENRGFKKTVIYYKNVLLKIEVWISFH